ncbi:MAG: hypothetical protein E6J61_10775 [Deltaproteobacteria bacterium]|nr:MAG: hypothetical protein E6J61_10775 [Deltaproteobacteria bacterium]
MFATHPSSTGSMFGDGFAGWCPLGPHGAVEDNPRYWVFVPSGSFLEPVRTHAVPMPQVTFPRVRPLPVGRPGPYAGPAPRIIEKQTRVRVRPVPVIDARTRVHPQVMPSGAVPLYRPRTAPIARSQPTAQRYGAVPARAAAKPASSESSKPGTRAAPSNSKH